MTITPGGGRQEGVAELVDDAFWNPHADPRSVWALVATYPVFVLALYRRSRPLLAATLLSAVVNVAAASPPETDEAWATRVVRGEQVWLERGLRSRPDALGLTAVGAAVNLYTIGAALKRQRGRTALGTVLSMLLTLVFFDRMVRLYDEYERPESPRSTPNER